MPATAIQGKRISYYINSVITVAIMIVFWFLPPAGFITEIGMKVLGVYIALLYGWSTVGFILAQLSWYFLSGVQRL